MKLIQKNYENGILKNECTEYYNKASFARREMSKRRTSLKAQGWQICNISSDRAMADAEDKRIILILE